jgi:hypothetical protein
VCSNFNDVYVSIMSPPPMGADPATGNISFDTMGDPLSINAAFLDVCDPNVTTGKDGQVQGTATCPAGPNELAATGFNKANDAGDPTTQDHGGTTWLQTTAPVTPGSFITLRFGIADAGDGILASAVVLDDFQWSANPGTVATKSCHTGDPGGDCNTCIEDAASGCCSSQFQACKFDTADNGCNALSQCLSFCNGIAACETQCHATHTEGEPAWDALLLCWYGNGQTMNEDPGACGKACGTSP